MMFYFLILLDKSWTTSKLLSGSQKRKLSISKSLIGNLDIILLDEPALGLDLTARRMWDKLKNYIIKL